MAVAETEQMLSPAENKGRQTESNSFILDIITSRPLLEGAAHSGQDFPISANPSMKYPYRHTPSLG